MAAVWAYHAYILRIDSTMASEAPRQAGIRRLYLYLIAAIGLSALLVGLSGDMSVFIRTLSGQFFNNSLKEQLAWFTAAIIAGLPVWILPWRSAQRGALSSEPSGPDERRSIVRKIYLYFFIFVATMTVLSSMVYIVYQVLRVILGVPGTGILISDIGQAIAYSLISIAVWLYHGAALRSDDRLNQQAQSRKLSDVHVAIVDTGDGSLAQEVMDGLRHDLPGLVLEPIRLQAAGTGGLEPGDGQAALTAQLAQANLIVGPWNIILPGGSVSTEIACTIAGSPARKLLIPTRLEGWDWAGVDRWDTKGIIRQTLNAVKQILEGDEVEPSRPLGTGAIVGIIIGMFFLLILLVIPILMLFSGVF
jgi:hypothetical protein